MTATVLDRSADPIEPEGPPESPPSAPSPAGGGLAVPVSALLASLAASWMAAGAFSGSLARVVAVLGPVLGAGAVIVAARVRRPAVVQYLALPAILVAGVVVAGGGDLPALIERALRSGGLSQPPVAFEPGWRFLLLAFGGLLALAAASLAAALDRPRLALALPLPFLLGGALAQPPGDSLVSTVVAFLFLIGALAVSYGDELARSGVRSGRFESRRLLRGAAAALALAAGVVGLAQLDALLPAARQNEVIPPARPQVPDAAPADRELFTVRADRPQTWRAGVLDVYRDNAWMTPPFDPDRLRPQPPPAPAAFAGLPTVTVEFTLSDDLDRVLPAVAGVVHVTGPEVAVDPRTSILRAPDGGSPERGLRYRLNATPPATAAQLAAAPAPPPAMREFLDAPEPPLAVRALLAEAPTTNAFERLQYVRNAFYSKVIAAGAGRPVDLPPSRVADMLEGKDASPYEITAAEALLARWAGVPSRLGYGWYGGEADGAGVYSVRPRNGATWLEAYFDGVGWVPIIGTPPRAKPSTSTAEKNEDPTVRPADQLALIVYVPVEVRSVEQVYSAVRFWLSVVLPVAAGLVALVAFLPVPLRWVRRVRRRQWVAGQGERGRVALAYGGLRDALADLGVGRPTDTPLELLGAVAEDAEHRELAWLVTRALWGDLARDLQPADAEAAEEMARSVLRRVRRAHPWSARLLAATSRASLRHPYDPDLPDGLRWRLGRRPVMAGGLAVVVAAGLLVVPSSRQERTGIQPVTVARTGWPGDLVLRGGPAVTLVRETGAEGSFARPGSDGLVTDGRVYSVHVGEGIEASVQLAALRPAPGGAARLRRGVMQAIGGGRFQPARIRGQRVFAAALPEQRIVLWFSPDSSRYVLLVARRTYADTDALFTSVLAATRGRADQPAGPPDIPVPDPRRGALT